MRKEFRRHKNRRFVSTRAIFLAAALPLLFSGCALFYLPLLILAPFQPFIILAAKAAARYGPILLMLVEADPQLPGQAPTMIAMQPATLTRETKLVGLEDQLAYEATHNTGIRSIILVESKAITPEWLADLAGQARADGCRLRAVFVDSRAFTSGRQLSSETLDVLNKAGISLRVTEGLAETIVNENAVAERLPIRRRVNENEAAYACLMSAVPAAL